MYSKKKLIKGLLVKCDRSKVAIANLLILIAQVWRFHILQISWSTQCKCVDQCCLKPSLWGESMGIIMLWNMIMQQFNPSSCNSTLLSVPSPGCSVI